MQVRTRRAVSVFLLLFGVTSFVFFLRLFLRVGLPQAQETAKGVVYLWVLTISIPLPITAGVVLLSGARSWRPFAAWWLLAGGMLALGSLRWLLPDYRVDVSFVVASAVCGLLPILAGLFLLLRPNR